MITELKKDTYTRNVEKLKNEIGQVCKLSGRNPDDILIVAASKYADAEQLKQVLELGINHFGENRAEELLKKYDFIGDDATWHFIGHLQSRKVKIVVPLVEYIHSIDSLSTLEKISQEANKNNKVQKVYFLNRKKRKPVPENCFPKTSNQWMMMIIWISQPS